MGTPFLLIGAALVFLWTLQHGIPWGRTGATAHIDEFTATAWDFPQRRE